MDDLKAAKPLTSLDSELYLRACDVLQTRAVSGKHTVGAAVRTANAMYVGLDLRSRKSWVCGEPGAISAAHSAGDYDLESIIAVCYRADGKSIVAISPCGSCRELINYHAPECRILFEDEDGMVEKRAWELFEYPTIPS